MWISLPLTEAERQWLVDLGLGLRQSRDELWRASEVELALVTHPVWDRWHLPHPPAPIVTVEVDDVQTADRIVDQGATWAIAFGRQPWGVTAGLLRFPSGLLVEILQSSPIAR